MIKLNQITPKNVKAFIEGYFRQAVIKLYYTFFSHVEEQVQWRIDQVAEKSPDCLINGECVICGCKIPELFYADKPCSRKENPCYPPLKGKLEWVQYKNQHASTTEIIGDSREVETTSEGTERPESTEEHRNSPSTS